jgi:hypothetical protein
VRESNNVSVKIESPSITAADLIARTGVEHDEKWTLGDTYGAFGATRRGHGLGLETKVSPTASLDEHVSAMIKRLAPAAQKLGQLGNEVEVTFTCKIESRRAPAIHFARDVVRWLAVMNAKLDVDTSVFVDPPKPASPGAPGAKPAGT